MKLITKEIESLFEKYPIGSQEGKMKDALVLVKYFNPMGVGTWLITEAEWDAKANTWIMFGYCHLYEWEWGYVALSDLENLKLPFGMGIERDLYCKGKTIGQLFSN